MKKADVIFVAVPDTKIPAIYKKDIEPNLTKGKTLLFSHGSRSTSRPSSRRRTWTSSWSRRKARATIVRRQFTEGKGVPSAHRHLPETPARTRRRSRSPGRRASAAPRGGVIETTFKEETETDLFGEQAVLCGGASALVQAGFEVLVEAGYSPRWPISSAFTSSSSSLTS